MASTDDSATSTPSSTTAAKPKKTTKKRERKGGKPGVLIIITDRALVVIRRYAGLPTAINFPPLLALSRLLFLNSTDWTDCMAWSFVGAATAATGRVVEMRSKRLARTTPYFCAGLATPPETLLLQCFCGGDYPLDRPHSPNKPAGEPALKCTSCNAAMATLKKSSGRSHQRQKRFIS